MQCIKKYLYALSGAEILGCCSPWANLLAIPVRFGTHLGFVESIPLNFGRNTVTHDTVDDFEKSEGGTKHESGIYEYANQLREELA